MAVIDVEGELQKWLPKQLTVGSDVFDLDWQPSKERGPHDPLYGTFDFISILPVRARREPRYVAKNVARSQTIPFTNGTLVYQVTYRDIQTITSITGTFGGNPHTFVADVDYKRTKTTGYVTYDAIEWLADGDKPDNSTDFTINYTSRMLEGHRDVWHRITYALQINAKEIAAGDSIGPSPASKAYSKTGIVMLLGQALSNWLVVRAGAPLGTDESPLIQLAFSRHEDFGLVRVPEGETLATHETHIVLHMRADAGEGDVYTIGKAVVTTLDTTLL